MNEHDGVLIEVRAVMSEFWDIMNYYSNSSTLKGRLICRDRLNKLRDENYEALTNLDALIAAVPIPIEYALKNYAIDDELPFIGFKSDKSMRYDSAYAIIDTAKLMYHATTEKDKP